MIKKHTIELPHPEDLIMKEEHLMDEKDYNERKTQNKKIVKACEAALKPKPFKITLKSRKLWVIKGYTATEGWAEEAFGEVLDGQLYTSEVLAKHAAEKLAAMYHQKIYADGDRPSDEDLGDDQQWISIESYLINTDGL